MRYNSTRVASPPPSLQCDPDARPCSLPTFTWRRQTPLSIQSVVSINKYSEDGNDASKPFLIPYELQQRTLGWEPWSSGYGKRLMLQRSWVRILATYTGWTFFTNICCKNCNDVISTCFSTLEYTLGLVIVITSCFAKKNLSWKLIGSISCPS